MAGRKHIGESRTSESRLAAVDRQRQALELRKAGVGYAKIAESLGYGGPSGAYNAIRSALKRTLQEPADELRSLEVERLDALLLGLWTKAKGGDTWAVDRVLRIMERRAALLGLDAPRRIENTGKNGGPMVVVHQRPDLSALTDSELELLTALGDKVAAGEVEP